MRASPWPTAALPMRAACALLASFHCACADLAPSEASAREQAVVYGADDRRDLYQLAAGDPLRQSARSVAAVIPRSAFAQGPDGPAALMGQTVAQTFSVCTDQPFALELGAAECTAFLIDDALLATAGHCFEHTTDCEKYVFVFDYVRSDQNAQVGLAPQNIFDCRRTRVQVDEFEPGVSKHDYALIELTRRVPGRPPLALRSEPVQLAEPVSVISAVFGLPFKFDRGGHVLDPRAQVGDFFRLDSDTAHGSSGAPVFDAAGLVLGVAVRGRKDYLLDEQAGCYVENDLAPPELIAPGEAVKFPGGNELYSEEASLLGPALAALCEGGYASPRLCDRRAVCGDLSCSGDETFALCPSDCADEPVSHAPRAALDGGAELAPVEPDAGKSRRAQGGDSCALSPCARREHGWVWLLTLAFGFAPRLLARAKKSSPR